MREYSPCKGCADRHPACHDSCERYKEWKERDQAQKKQLKEASNRFSIIGSEARDKIRYSYNQRPNKG